MNEAHGLSISRRHLINGSTAAVLVALLGGRLTASDAPSSSTWEEFLRTARERGRDLLKDPTTPVDEYLYLLASLATRIDAVPPAKVQDVSWTDPPVRFGMASRGAPFVVIEWQLAPGAILPAHNHPSASVCTVGLEGEAEIDNYEIVGAAPAYDARTSFRLRRTNRQLIGPRRVNTLGPQRDNIHTLRSAKGARGIDITSLHGPVAPFSYLQIEEWSDGITGRWYKPPE